MNRGIVAAGNWIVDRVKMIDRWPNVGELCNIVAQDMSGGGGPCNVLFDLAAMGTNIPLYACGLVGNDSEGSYLIEQAQSKGINTDHLRSCEAPTSYTDVMTIQADGRRTFFHNRGANSLLGLSEISAITAPAKLFYLGYLLLLDGLDRPDPMFGTIAARSLKCMQDRGYKTVVDVVSEDGDRFAPVKHALRCTDYLVINEVEAASCTSIEVRDSEGTICGDRLTQAMHLLKESGVREWVVVHYPEGAAALDKDNLLHLAPPCPIETEDIVGAVGAGDAFCAGLIYGIHEDKSVVESLRLAAASAWFNLHAATSSGGAPTLSQIQERLENWK